MKVAFAGLRHGHIFALKDLVEADSRYELVGAFEENREAKLAAEKLGMDCRYPDYEALLADDSVEAVALGGCFGDRGRMAEQALKAGKHVISDKPLCISLGELEAIRSAAAESGKKALIWLSMREEPIINAVRDLYRSGELGDIVNVYFGGQHPLQYGRRPGWYFEKGKYGGVINDIAIHGIDALNYLFGVYPTRVCAARTRNRFAVNEPQFEDCGQFMLECSGNVGVLGDVSYAIPDGVEFALPYYWRFAIWGTEGTAEFAVSDKRLTRYKKGVKEPLVMETVPGQVSFLTEVLKETAGEPSVFSMEECLAATERTLAIQSFADKYKEN